MSRLMGSFKKLATAVILTVGVVGTASADTVQLSSAPNTTGYTLTNFNTIIPGSAFGGVGYFAGISLAACTSAGCVNDPGFTNGQASVVWTITVPGITDVLTFNNPHFSFSGTDLTITASGTSVINGGVSQAIALNLTAQNGFNSAGGSFSATVSAVPLPGALALFGSAMVGVWGWSRRRKSRDSAASSAAAVAA